MIYLKVMPQVHPASGISQTQGASGCPKGQTASGDPQDQGGSGDPQGQSIKSVESPQAADRHLCLLTCR